MSTTEKLAEDTIAAIATPQGRGGVGIVRISGNRLEPLLHQLCHVTPEPRKATNATISDASGRAIDQVLVLYFPAPHSFTGEDVIEIHGHGGPVVMDSLLQRALEFQVRLATPGEFSQRAFLNDKIDLAQAEAIADLIDASSKQAAQSAVRSLQGEFSEQIHRLVNGLTELRVYIEAAIDFPDEEVDFLSDGEALLSLERLNHQFAALLGKARQGVLLRDGMSVVIAGKPNVGKSSLLNALCGRDSAIVTDIAGTTRDVLREYAHLDGMPVHFIDTAGLRESEDPVEKEGIRRARREIQQADRVLFVVDVTARETTWRDQWPEFFERLPENQNLTLVFNKIDQLVDCQPSVEEGIPTLFISAKTGEGLDNLREHLKACMGYQVAEEGTFMARRRHLDLLKRTQEYLHRAHRQLKRHRAGELAAEDLRAAQNLLGEITGEFTADDLLGKIFSSFCLGK